MSQKQKVLEYMQTHKEITQEQAYFKFGIMRLAPRICELREEGYNILSNRKTVINRFGEKCSIASYSLVKGADAYQ